MGSAAAYARARESVLRICRGEADARTLRLETLDAIRRAVSFDAYAWLLTDPETSVGSSPLADIPCLPLLPQLIRLKYLTAVNRWTGLPSAVASLREATGGNLSRSLMWRELLGRYEVTDIASSVYRDRFGCWGFLDLWRIGTPAFTETDIEFLGHIAGPVTAALRHGLARTFVPATGGDQVPPTGPVVLLLSPDLEVRAQTPQTQRYLRILVPPDADGPGAGPGRGEQRRRAVARGRGRGGRQPAGGPRAPGQRPVADAPRGPDGHHPGRGGGDLAVSIEPSTASDRGPYSPGRAA